LPIATTAPITLILQSPPSEPKWTEELQAVGTPCVAVLAAFVAGMIAYRQWRTAEAAKETARNKLKLDLFEKRWAIYEAASSLISDSFLSDDSFDYSPHDWMKLREQQQKLNGANWLLDEKVNAYLMKIGMDAEHRHRMIVRRQSEATPSTAAEVMQRNWQDNMKRVREELGQLNELFAPFMTIQH
jgi:hypothetical protein